MPNVRAAVLVALAFVAAVAGRVPLLVFAIGVAIAAGGELFRLERGRGERPVVLAGLGGIIGLLIAAHVRGEHVVTATPGIVAAVVGVSFLAVLARRDRGNATRAIAYTTFPVLVVGLLGSYVIALRGSRDGFRLVVVLLAMALAADLAPLLRERRGEHAHRPSTLERAALSGGAALMVAIVAALAFSPPFSWSRAIVLAIVVTAIQAAADASADMIDHVLARTEPGVRPRRAPIYRRLDGVLFSAPFFFYAFRVLAR